MVWKLWYLLEGDYGAIREVELRVLRVEAGGAAATDHDVLGSRVE